MARQTTNLGGRGLLVFAILWNAISWTVFVVMVVGALRGNWPMLAGAAFSLLFVAIGALLAYLALRNTLARLKITRPNVVLSAASFPLGGQIDYEVSFSAKASVDIAAFDVELTCQEIATYRQGTDTHTVHRMLFEQKHELMGREQLIPGDRIERKGTFRVPVDGMHSFKANHNRIDWVLQVRVSIEGWPDYVEDVPVEVDPLVLMEL